MFGSVVRLYRSVSFLEVTFPPIGCRHTQNPNVWGCGEWEGSVAVAVSCDTARGQTGFSVADIRKVTFAAV